MAMRLANSLRMTVLICLWVGYLEADVRRNERKMQRLASWEFFGKARGTDFEIQIFLQFSCDEQVSKFGFFRFSRNF
jgi:hypothetical protein